MRALILVAGALGLAACGSSDQTGNMMNVDENLRAENIVANDVTAIDAVTADAANMAADVDINFTNEQLATTGNRAAGEARPRATGPKPQSAPVPAPSNTIAPAAEPASNTVGNTTE